MCTRFYASILAIFLNVFSFSALHYTEKSMPTEMVFNTTYLFKTIAKFSCVQIALVTATGLGHHKIYANSTTLNNSSSLPTSIETLLS